MSQTRVSRIDRPAELAQPPRREAQWAQALERHGALCRADPAAVGAPSAVRSIPLAADLERRRVVDRACPFADPVPLRRNNGPAVMRTSPVPPPLWMLFFAAAQWLVSRHLPLLTLVAAPYTRLGWAVMALALLPALGAFIQFRQARTTVNPHHPEKTAVLVTGGVYAWTRNPMYLGLWLVLLGWAIRLGTLSALIGAALFLPLMGRVQIRAEEQALRRRFGVEFERYCRTVHRWFGRRLSG